MNKTIEEILHAVGYTQDGTKSNFSFNEVKLVAERYAKSQTQDLTVWKESASKVFKNLDLQTLGKTLGIGLGEDVSTNILPKVMELIEQNRELVEMLENVAKARRDGQELPVLELEKLISKIKSHDR